MKIIKIKKKHILMIIILIIFIIVITKLSTAFAMQNYYKIDFTTGLVTASSLNVRSGPRNQFSSCNKSL